MTNPTPMTAETLAKDLVAIYNPVAGSQDLGVPYIATRIEAYAAQQTAVAEGQVKATNLLLDRANTYIDELEAENERLKQQNAGLVTKNKILRELNIDIAKDFNKFLAENERLKQAAALFREASFQAHSSHWDSQGTNGANCSACFRASSLRRQADDLLTQPPKEAT